MFVVMSQPCKYNQKEIKTVIKLFEKGMTQFNLRKPELSSKIYTDFLDQIPTEYHCKIVTHAHHEILCSKYKIKGIHLNKKMRNQLEYSKKLNEYTRSFQDKNYITSTGFRSICEIQKTSSYFDQIYLSPIFTSISKTNYKGIEINVSKYKSFDIIALGGITTNNINQTKSLGYKGIAVLGSIWNKTNPLEQYDELHKAYRDNFI